MWFRSPAKGLCCLIIRSENSLNNSKHGRDNIINISSEVNKSGFAWLIFIKIIEIIKPKK